MAKRALKVTQKDSGLLQPVFQFSLTVKYFVLALIGLIFYGNTLRNEYALDDNAVILGNAYVQKGISGIPKIMTTDAWNSYLQKSNSADMLNGGRYRPLSLVFFAIEQSLFGGSAFMRHLVNIVFFVVTILLIFYFLSNFLLIKSPYGADSAFVAAILFAVHPIHTEVVANCKSLDEILSLFFILLTFIFSLEYTNQKRIKFLCFASGSFFLALLSKEYAIVLVILLPMLFYLYKGDDKKRIISLTIPYLIIAFIYIALRVSAVGLPHSDTGIVYLSINNQLRSDPYYLARGVQKFATEWYSLGKYILMLFVPYPLSCDYSYNQIPYHDFSNILVWLSIFAYESIIYWGYKLLRKRDLMAFPTFLFLLMLLPVSNFFINVGAMFGERFDYHASLGFVIIVSCFAFRSISKVSFELRRMGTLVGVVVLILVCAIETTGRNADWKNNFSLFMHDVKVVPNSEFIDDGASVAYINLAVKNGNESRKTEMLDTAIMFCQRAIKIDKTFPDLFMNAGLAYYNLSKYDSAKYYWDILGHSGSRNPQIKQYQTLLANTYLDEAKTLDNPLIAIREIRKGISEDSTIAELWFTLAGAYYTIKQFDSAEYSWVKGTEYKADSSKGK